MYSQYQQYRQHHGGAAVATQQNSLSWNGREWVQTHGRVASGSRSTHPSDQVADPVVTYTQYYHQWKAKEAEEERRSQALYGEAKEEAQRQAAWARYYAEQASRAAHHYHNNPQSAAPQPPPVPPSGPSSRAPDTTVPSSPAQSTARASAPGPSRPPAKEKPSSVELKQSPGGLKRYVHRCLTRCKGKEVELMQKEIEKVISYAIKTNTMHTTNWDEKELLPIPSVQKESEVKTDERQADLINTTKSVREKPAEQTRGDEDGGYGRYERSNSQRPEREHWDTPREQTNHANDVRQGELQRSDGAHNLPMKQVLQEDKGRFSSSISYSPKYDKSGPKNKKRKTTKVAPKDNYSYYGNSMSTESKSGADDDFVPVPRIAPKKQTKKEKKVSKLAGKKRTLNGFERSSDVLAKRANRFSGAGGIDDVSMMSLTTADNISKYMGKGLIGGNKKLDETDFEKMTVKGTCMNLEKEYLRLTAPPRAKLVRPQPVLERHLRNLKAEWTSKHKRDYVWFCSQFKAMRQDLTVQRIFNGFAISVYESHAKIALEEGDLNEFNQCQTQLKELYEGMRHDEEAVINENEFIAYRLIYYVFLTGNKKYQEGSSDFFKIMLSLTPKQRQDPHVSHALKVRHAVAEFDYHNFFRLLTTCSKPGSVALMKFMVPNVRAWALRRMCKAYRPSLSVKFVLAELGFSEEVSEGKEWLRSCGCVLSKSGENILTKESVVQESTMKGKTSLI